MSRLRMGRLRLVIGVAVLALAGCAGDEAQPNQQDEAAPAPGPIPSVGQCYDPDEEAFDTHIDESNPVSCDEPHTLETAHVVTADEPITPDNVDTHVSACRQAVADYLGAAPVTSRLELHFIVASEQTQQAGQHWVRCDVVANEDTHGETPERRTGSLADALAERVPTELRACLNAPPDPENNQRYVACAEPHIAELVPETVTLGEPNETFPGSEELGRRAETACNDLLASGYPEHIGRNWAFPSQESWASGDRTGVCWVSATLPAITDEEQDPEPERKAEPGRGSKSAAKPEADEG